jgi:hypothetical protein
MRKFYLAFLGSSMLAISLQAQTFTSGLTTTGTGATANTRLGGTSPLLVNTTIDLGTFTFGLKTTALPNLFSVLNNGNIGIGIAPTSLLHLKAGVATFAPLKFTSGVNLTTPAAGAMEYDGTNLYFTPAAARKTIGFNDFSNILAGSTLAATNGGTGQTTLTIGDMLYASAANTFAKRTIGTTGQVLTVVGGLPTWATPAAGGSSPVGNNGNIQIKSGTSFSTPALDSLSFVAGQGLSVKGTIRGNNGANDIILEDGSGRRAFRSVNANAWTDNLAAQFFQIGDINDKVAFTARNGSNMTRALFAADKLQLSAGTYSLTPAPTDNFEIINTANTKVLGIDAAGAVKFSGALMPNNTAGTAGQVLTSAGAGAAPVWAAPTGGGGGGWSLTGNAGTNAWHKLYWYH